MVCLNNNRLAFPAHNHFIQLAMCIAFLFLFGCTTNSSVENIEDAYTVKVHNIQSDKNKQKRLFVFLDGTLNDPNSRTNVWRLYQSLLQNNDRQMTATYIEGVGSTNSAPITGAVLGRGMEQRILEAYRFISENYNPGDEIYIFGFSRGAHQARSLAGLISYAGVPATSTDDRNDITKIGNQIIEIVKKKSDGDHLNKWISWQPGQGPLLAEEIKNKLKLDMHSAEVRFLGVWDTVPGSSLKDYETCKEEKGFVKNSFYWLIPGIDKGERYKTDSYPAIRRIAHAVSLDEKRSKFRPLLLCEPINAQYTNVSEVWFPGAHADIGGGYEDSDELSSISLEWMIQLLDEFYNIEPSTKVEGNAKGLAHWSMGDSPANTGSKCEDRHPPEDAEIHTSVDEREKASPVPVLWEEKRRLLDYPISCLSQ